jgi:hypothetical protein
VFGRTSRAGVVVSAIAMGSSGFAAAQTSDDEPISLASLAGAYYAEGPSGGSCRLVLRAEGGYSEACFQGDTMTLHRGRIQLGRTRLALWREGNPARFASPADLDSLDGALPGVDNAFLPPIWRPVIWGERRYLLSRTQLLHFCIAVAEGSEPRSRRVGPFYLREGDETKRPPASSSLHACSVPPESP